MTAITKKSVLVTAHPAETPFTSSAVSVLDGERLLIMAENQTATPTGALTLQISEDGTNWVDFGAPGTLAVPLVVLNLSFEFVRVSVVGIGGEAGQTYDLIMRIVENS